VRAVAISTTSALRSGSDRCFSFATLLLSLLFFRFEIIPVGLGQLWCIPDVSLPLFCHRVRIDAFVTRDEQIHLIDPLISPIIATLAVLLGPMPRDHLFGFFEVFVGQSRYVFQGDLPPVS